MDKKEKIFFIAYSFVILIIVLFANLDNYKEILTASLAFIGTVIALIVTLTAALVQNILGKYSQDLVKKIGDDGELRLYLLISLFIFGFNFSTFIIPDLTFKQLSYFLTMIYLFILVFYFNRVLYLLDIRNHITEISNLTIQYMKSNVTELNNSNPTKLKRIKDETEIIIDVIQKSIQENRFEIVDSGFKNIEKIVIEYISLNKSFLRAISKEEFLDHILNNLINSKSLVSANKHPKIIKSFANCSGNLAKETYTINCSHMNYLSREFVDLLIEVVFGHEMEKETSNMPAEACDQLVAIGEIAIDNKDPLTAGNINGKLGKINRIATKMKNLRGDLIARYINLGMIRLLKYSLENLDKFENHQGYILNKMIEEINLNITTYAEDNYPHSDINISTLTRFLNQDISSISQTIIEKIRENEKDNGNFLYEILSKLIYSLNSNIKLCIETKKDSSAIELLNNSYTIGIQLTKLVTEIEDEKLKKNSKQILANIFDKLYETITFYLKTDDGPLYESLPIYFSFMGLMFYENRDSTEFSNIIEKQILNIVELFEKEHIDLPNYTYVRLMGSWALKWKINPKLLKKIKDIVKIQDKLISERESKALKTLPDIEGRKYSELFTRKTIEIPISPSFNPGVFELENNSLFDEENRENFEIYLEKKDGELKDI